MVVVSFYLNRRFFPTPYPVRRIAEYVVLALLIYGASVLVDRQGAPAVVRYAINLVLLAAYTLYAVRRERIDVKGLLRSVLHRGR